MQQLHSPILSPHPGRIPGSLCFPLLGRLCLQEILHITPLTQEYHLKYFAAENNACPGRYVCADTGTLLQNQADIQLLELTWALPCEFQVSRLF